MAGRTPREAVRNFVRPIQQSLACVTQALLRYPAPDPERSGTYELVLADGTPQRLRSDPRVALVIQQRFRVVEVAGETGPWKTKTEGYIYALYRETGEEAIAFHWHPWRLSSLTHVHVHTDQGGSTVVGRHLNKLHLLTGRISVEQVLRFAIVEFGVRARADYDHVLTRNLRRHVTWRTWA
jgi:hypothetical protein